MTNTPQSHDITNDTTRRRIVWLLQRLTSFSLWKRKRDAFAIFANQYESAVKTQPEDDPEPKAKLNFGTIGRCSVDLDTATLLGLKAAYEEFAKTGQDLKNFRICVTDESAARTDPGPEDYVINVTFVAKMPSGVRGLGNASPLGTSIKYVVSPETGEILGAYSTK
ncbi:hypothetical protein BDI4_180020 [Burkholderia diffusa]|nr:hypothetical protein BDI4_180020 [Burkholderia diffusa]